MSGRSKRAKKKPSRRNLYISVAIVAILAVAIAAVAVHEYGASPGSSTSSTSSSSSSGTGSRTSVSTGTGNYAVLDTSQGTIVIQLLPNVAPQTVTNFVSLANVGFYNGLVWHRLLNPATNNGFGIIQTGDPSTKGAINSTRDEWGDSQGPDTEPLEANSAYPNVVGSVAIAHTASSTSGGSQFYINVTNNTSLNGQYTVFGEVVQGMSVVNALSVLPVYTNSNSFAFDQPIDAQSALLISVTIQSSP